VDWLKGIFTKAIGWGFAIKNPVKGVKLTRENARVRFLAAEEISSLVAACGKERKAPYLRSVVILALFTGLKKMDLLNLKREHVHLDRDILEVDEGKGGHRRFVPLHPTAKIEIARLMLQGKSENVIHDKDGEPFKDIKTSFNSAVKRAGLHDMHFHDLRRTFGTLGAIAARIDEKAMQKL
jgi:integrase